MADLYAAGAVIQGVSGGVYLLIGAGALAFFAALLTVRESRQKRYDERQDKTLTAALDRNDELEKENDKLREEQARLRFLCRSKGIDPDQAVSTP